MTLTADMQRPIAVGDVPLTPGAVQCGRSGPVRRGGAGSDLEKDAGNS